MHHWPWRAMIIGAVATVLIYTATRPDPDTRGLSQATADELIDQLSSSRDVVQRAAATRLISLGGAAIPALEAAAEQAEEAQLRQIILVLEDLYLSTDDSVADAVEDAVERLKSSDRMEVRRLAEHLFQANLSRRQMRAYAKIESFAGKLIVLPSMQLAPGSVVFPELVVIGDDWTGGDEGLKHLARLQGLRSIHIADGAPLSEEAIQQLNSVASSIRRESDGCLGVLLSPGFKALCLRGVVTNSPADLAGLQPDDELTKLNGQPLDDYAAFQSLLRSHPPGDTVQFEFVRDGEVRTVDVVLGSDFGTGRCRCRQDIDEPETARAYSSNESGRRSRALSDHFIGPPSDQHASPSQSPMGRAAETARPPR